jgi:hypothetical protein
MGIYTDGLAEQYIFNTWCMGSPDKNRDSQFTNPRLTGVFYFKKLFTFSHITHLFLLIYYEYIF